MARTEPLAWIHDVIIKLVNKPITDAYLDGASDIDEDMSLVFITALRSFDVDNLQDSDHTPVAILANASSDEIETFIAGLELEVVAMLSENLGGGGWISVSHSDRTARQAAENASLRWRVFL